MRSTDPTVNLLAILELIENAEEGPDGMLTPEVQEAIRMLGGVQAAQGRFSLEEDDEPPCYEECFGSEPPGKGWVYAGECRWVRGRRRVKAPEGE